MPFNPNLPLTDSEMRSDEMRNQFNGLKDLIDAIPPAVPEADPVFAASEAAQFEPGDKAKLDSLGGGGPPASGDYSDGVEEFDTVRLPSNDHDTLVMVGVTLTVEQPPGSAQVQAYSDAANPPTTLRAVAAYNANAADGENQQQLIFVVKKGHRYKLTKSTVSASAGMNRCYEFPVNL